MVAGIIEVPVFTDERGSLASIEFSRFLPFAPQRFYYIYGTGGEARRGGHSHWKEAECVFAVAGSFQIDVTNRSEQKTTYRLERPEQLLILPPGHWHELHSFEPGSICCVLASHPYDRDDYCRDYDEFLRILRAAT